MLFSSTSVSKLYSPPEDIAAVLEGCNTVYKVDFYGTEYADFTLTPDSMSDFMLLAKDQEGSPVGVVALAYHDGRALELKTVSVWPTYRCVEVAKFLLEKEAPAAILRWCGPGPAWFVKAIPQNNRRFRRELRRAGFLPPESLADNLSSEGYIPFDPFDHLLMRRAVVFPTGDYP